MKDHDSNSGIVGGIGEIQKKLSDMRGTDVNSFPVKQMIGEYDLVAKQLYRIDDPKILLLDIAKGYQENEELLKGVVSVYGEGAAAYRDEAIESFHKSMKS